MKIWTRIEWQMTEAGLEKVLEECFDYGGPVAECKGEGMSKKQLERQNKLVDETIAYQKTFMDPVREALMGYLTREYGFSPEQMAMMQSQFLDDSALQSNNAGNNLRSALASRGMSGGELPASGLEASGIAELEAIRGATQAEGLRGIRLANLQQALQNRFNAANAFMGNAGTLSSNIGTFNAGASNALNQYVQASNSGFGANFMRALGGGLGKGLGMGITGGIGNAIGKIPGMG